MKKVICLLSLISIFLSSCNKDYTSKNYLRQVVESLEKIESARYQLGVESWQHGDTSAAFTVNEYVESYRNPADTTIGSSWIIFESDDKSHFKFAYDGKMRTIVYDEYKGMVIDSFKVRKLPFRPVTPPFFNYSESIIKYILNNTDSTQVIYKDLGGEVYVKLTIMEDRQVEFFGKAHFIKKNPYTLYPESIYELWIDKETNLPRKVRREMSHDISVSYVSDYKFNTLKLEDFNASKYFPKDYEIRQYGESGNKSNSNELEGKRAKDWTLQNDNKLDFSLSDIKSKVAMVQFTSVSCGPCRASVPFLNELSKEYDKEDFDFLVIECTSRNTNVLKSYKKRHNIAYEMLLSNKEVLKDYSINSYPVFFLLDENRKITKVIKGYMEESTDHEIRDLIDKMI
jgi:thiol-disulfide isomerase/thioredoxin/outer membrane lipoprotein-sorting protein